MSGSDQSAGDFSGPYRGLEPFDEKSAAFFFGRERDTRLITASMFASPLTLLYGASGVGKSSVLRAGVLPRLRARKDLLPVMFPRFADDGRGGGNIERGWQTDPVSGIKETVALALFDLGKDDPARLRRYRDVVRAHDMSPLHEFFGAVSAACERRLMVILDQFEEYSLYHPEDELFAKQFPLAIAPRDRSVSFLVSLREDALAKLDRFKGRIPTLWDSYRRIDHLDRPAAEDAIRLPLRAHNERLEGAEKAVEIEDDLVANVLDHVQASAARFESGGIESVGGGTLAGAGGGDPAGGRIETPYLQLVMSRLWEREQSEGSAVLRMSTFADEGYAETIVRTHLDRVMAQFTAEEQDVAAKVFHRLVTPSGAKIAFSAKDLAEYEAIDEKVLAPILQRLEEGSRRILRRVAVRAEESEEPRYEIFHDRLGPAILAWRTKRLTAQKVDVYQRQEAEQKRVEEESQAALRARVDAAMDGLRQAEKALWITVMFEFVSVQGRRYMVPQRQLDDGSTRVVQKLVNAGLLRIAGLGQQEQLEIVNDATARALLEWHSRHLQAQKAAREEAPRDEAVTAPAPVESKLWPPAPEMKARPARAPAPAAAVDTPPEERFPYALVRDLLKKGEVVPFLGAGVSMSARASGGPSMPTGQELKEQLARLCDFPVAEFEASSIAEVASYLVQRRGRRVLDDLLEGLLGRPELKPSETHRYLAKLARDTPLLILTTNYDTLMERALDEAHVAHDVAAYVHDDAAGKDRLSIVPSKRPTLAFTSALRFVISHLERPLVLRLHGPTFVKGHREGSHVLTEEDQIDWLFRLRSGSVLPGVATHKLHYGRLLSLGHSARDWSQRALLRTLVTRTDERTTGWAVALNPSPLSVLTWQRYRMEAHSADLDDWVARMRSA